MLAPNNNIIIMTHCRFILPIEGVGLIIWWVVEEIVTNSSTWWLIETDTLATTLMEWAIILLIFIGLNWWMGPLKIYEPKDRFSRTVLGLIFKFTPRRKFHSSEDKTVFVTPDAVCTYSSICSISAWSWFKYEHKCFFFLVICIIAIASSILQN